MVVRNLKKLTLSLLAISVVILMTTSVYAQIPDPPTLCGCPPDGFTPGFWKHNIRVYLDLTNGKYNAFGSGPREGEKLTDETMENLLDAINLETGSTYTFPILLDALNGPGWSVDRTNAANWLNWAAGYGPY